MRLVPTFELAQENEFRDFVAKHPRVLVLFRGVGCAYSATFERVFLEGDSLPGWERAIRRVEEGGEGPVGEALGIEVTPTLEAFVGGSAAKRLPGRLSLGIPRSAYRRWLKSL